MSSAIETLNNEDLMFFGKVNASISHELKNIMATISETAGLLNDLTEMATKGHNFELEMMKTCSQDIFEEIQRGFAAIKRMNTFSHSIDDPLKRVNLIEILDLMINLAGFLSIAAKVHFEPPQEISTIVITCPWRLQNLIYQALVFAFESAGPDGKIQVELHPQNNGSARITLAGLGSKNAGKFPGDKIIQIAESIGVEIVVNEDTQSFDFLVPELISNLR
jgi:hypothetical protein